MHEWSTKMLLRHYLDEGLTKTELSRRFGVSRRTIHYWIESGQLDRDLATGHARYWPRAPVASKLKAVIDADCHQGLEQLRGLLSHVDPRMTIGQLVGRIVQEALDRHDPSRPPRRARTGSRSAEADSKPASASKEQAAPKPGHASTVPDAATPAGTTPTAEERTPQPSRQGATHRRPAARKPTGAVTSTAKPCAAGRAIPAAVRRQIWQRDGCCCSYVDRQTGRRCNSRHMIEIDHSLPYAMGGADTVNLGIYIPCYPSPQRGSASIGILRPLPVRAAIRGNRPPTASPPDTAVRKVGAGRPRGRPRAERRL